MTDAIRDLKMWPGAMAASALPMILGLGVTAQQILSGQAADWIFILPVSLCFLFGTPIAAWLACRALRGQDPIEWGGCLYAGLGAATRVQFWAALFYTFGVIIFSSPGLLDSGGLGAFFVISISSLLMNCGLWFVVTAPLSAFCATIFWCVTKFPDDASGLE